MHGNLWEWCDDLFDLKGDSRRMIRGGAFDRDARHCGAAIRDAFPPSGRGMDMGLRLARVPVGKEIVRIIAPDKK